MCRVGEGFVEILSCYYTVSESCSCDKPAKLTAIFTVETEEYKGFIMISW